MKIHARYLLIAAVVSILSMLVLPGSSARLTGNKPVKGDRLNLEAALDVPPSADLEVTKSGSDTVTAGANITYTITVTNAGPDPAASTTLSDPLPANTTFVSLSSPAGWSCTTPAVGANGTVTCSIASLAVTSGDVFTLVVHVHPSVPVGTFISNTATVSTATFDPNQENNSSTATTAVVGTSADVGVTKSGPDTVTAGANITYTITVINGGPDPAANTTLSDTLPATLTFVSLSSPAGWSCLTPAVGAGGTVTCTHPSLAITTGDVFTLVVNVPANAPPGTFFTNTATVSTTTQDPNNENNSASTSTLMGGNSADIAVTKTASSDQVAPGFPLTYTIQVSNGGPDSADNVTLNDVLPATVTFVSLSQPAGWTCMTPAVGAGGTVNCTRPSLAVTSGDIFTIVVVVRSDTPVDTVVTNTATVSTSTTEPTDENNSDTASATVVAADPTAANGKVSGRILDDLGNPVSGAVIRLSGTDSRKIITDSNGNYHFDNVETNGFYTVTPARVNYNFSPFNRSFSQLGSQTEAVFGASFTGDTANPLDTPEYFVRQHYLDFLGREPDEAGFNFWSDQIIGCGDDFDCVDRKKINVSAAYFLSIEFQETGGLVDGLYRVSYGRRPSYSEFKPDAGAIAQDVVVGNQGWEGTLANNKAAFIDAFVNRAAFHAAFDRLSNDAYVDALIANTGVSFTTAERERLVSGLEGGLGGSGMTRAGVLRAIVENGQVVAAKRNQAFVMMEYFGYLRREPDTDGYQFWLNKLNQFNGNFEQAEMVKSFIISGEYRQRFPR